MKREPHGMLYHLLDEERLPLLHFEETEPITPLVFRKTRKYWWQFWRPKNTNRIRKVSITYHPRT